MPPSAMPSSSPRKPPTQASTENLRAVRYFLILALLGTTMQLSLLFHSSAPLGVWLKQHERSDFDMMHLYDTLRAATDADTQDQGSNDGSLVPKVNRFFRKRGQGSSLDALVASSIVPLKKHELEVLHQNQDKVQNDQPFFGQSLTSRLAHFLASIELFPRTTVTEDEQRQKQEVLESLHVEKSTINAMLGHTQVETTAQAVPKRREDLTHGSSAAAAGKHGHKHNMPQLQVVVTGDGKMYSNWQLRIMYFSLQKAMEGHEYTFTRILHSMSDDELVDYIPTVRIKPRCDPQCRTNETCASFFCGYMMHERPHAIREWLERPNTTLGDLIFIAETDYIFLNPITIPTEPNSIPKSFAFTYMTFAEGRGKVVEHYLRQYNKTLPKPSKWGAHYSTGPAPALLSAHHLRRIAPLWDYFALQFQIDQEAALKLGWVREMYAYDMAAYVESIPHFIPSPKRAPGQGLVFEFRDSAPLIVQTPESHHHWGAPAIHYTYDIIIGNKTSNETIWSFEKRKLSNHVPSLDTFKMPPPKGSHEELFLVGGIGGYVVTEALLDTLHQMMSVILEAMATLPRLCNHVRPKQCFP
mmetsp:Transcript_11711/g.42790  ORF Transcript_11711/g.42790 Transcript_11711/m.42790 type:complete len:583 (-) Transcript_11711:143-1891(-)